MYVWNYNNKSFIRVGILVVFISAIGHWGELACSNVVCGSEDDLITFKALLA